MKKNILATTVALTSSAVISMIASLVANASCAETDSALRNEVESSLGSPICILPDEEIPQEAWNAVWCCYDTNQDGEIHVNDAIQAKKEGNSLLSKAICNYIISGHTENSVTLSPVPLKDIDETIKSDSYRLISVWQTERGETRFMFFNEDAASVFIYENGFITEAMGFTKMWDYDNDRKVTEKDAAAFYLYEDDEVKAIASSSYAQYKTGAFAVQVQRPDNIALDLETVFSDSERRVELVYTSENQIVCFDYSKGIIYFVC